MDNMNKAFLAVVFGILLAAPVFANTTYTCLGNSLEVNTSIRTIVNGVETNTTTYETVACPLGCRTNENFCIGQATNSGFALPIIVIFIAVTAFFFYISISIQLGEEGKEKSKFLMPMVKVLFFFFGLLTIDGLFIFGMTISRDFGNTAIANTLEGIVTAYTVVLGFVILVTVLKIIEMIIEELKKNKQAKMVGRA
jgi:hypothetical protein